MKENISIYSFRDEKYVKLNLVVSPSAEVSIAPSDRTAIRNW
jgi:hypothetical protein